MNKTHLRMCSSIRRWVIFIFLEVWGAGVRCIPAGVKGEQPLRGLGQRPDNSKVVYYPLRNSDSEDFDCIRGGHIISDYSDIIGSRFCGSERGSSLEAVVPCASLSKSTPVVSGDTDALRHKETLSVIFRLPENAALASLPTNIALFNESWSLLLSWMEVPSKTVTVPLLTAIFQKYSMELIIISLSSKFHYLFQKSPFLLYIHPYFCQLCLKSKKSLHKRFTVQGRRRSKAPLFLIRQIIFSCFLIFV